MKGYRLVLLLKSDLKKEAKDKLYDEIKKWLGDVKSDKVTSLGEKKLAYTIKHAKSGEYVVMNFESDKVTADFNKRLLIRDEILRHLLVRN
ncbi:MAG TPA: 30S ribosomal protein S6 [Patescibacteria group bacterium]|nr:30S ribosomal protein S6 [Patescibacteria group bacterium]